MFKEFELPCRTRLICYHHDCHDHRSRNCTLCLLDGEAGTQTTTQQPPFLLFIINVHVWALDTTYCTCWYLKPELVCLD